MKHIPSLLSAALITVQILDRNAGAQTNPPEVTSSDVVATRTRALFKKGLAAYNAGQVETARQLFLQAWEIRPSADVAMELAQTEMDLGNYVQAAGHLDYAMRNFTPSINEKMRNIARQAHAEALRHVTRLNVKVNQNGSEIFLNGRVVGRSPLPEVLYAEPGDCVVEARLGASAASQTLSAEPGAEIPVDLVLEVRATGRDTTRNDFGPIRGNAQPSPYSAERSPRSSLVPVALGGTLAVVGFATGIGLRLAAEADEDQAKRLAATVGVGGCRGTNGDSANCRALSDSLKSSDTESNWSTACLVIGSAAAVATAVYWFWPRKTSTSSSRPEVSASVAAGQATLLISGGF